MIKFARSIRKNTAEETYEVWQYDPMKRTLLFGSSPIQLALPHTTFIRAQNKFREYGSHDLLYVWFSPEKLTSLDTMFFIPRLPNIYQWGWCCVGNNVPGTVENFFNTEFSVDDDDRRNPQTKALREEWIKKGEYPFDSIYADRNPYYRTRQWLSQSVNPDDLSTIENLEDLDGAKLNERSVRFRFPE